VTPAGALAFVRKHGVVLMAARGPVPSLAEAIAGGPFRGSWWGHADAQRMFLAFDAVGDSDQVLTCRLVGGKVTYVHRRLWPALVRLAPRLPKAGLAAIREEHTAKGQHRIRVMRFPRWAPPEVLRAGRALDESKAARILGEDLLRALEGRRRAR
jgi:hypothetical protein